MQEDLPKPRLVCECILVVWSAIYLGIAIRFWILLSWSLPLPCIAWSKWSPLPQRAWVLGRTDLQGEHGSLSKQGPLPDRMLPYIGKKEFHLKTEEIFWSNLKQKRYFEAISKVAIPFRLLCIPGPEDSLAIAIMVCTGPYFLFFCRYCSVNNVHSHQNKYPLKNGLHRSVLPLSTVMGTYKPNLTFHPTFSIQGFQACWSHGDHGLQNACTGHCQVSRIQSVS